MTENLVFFKKEEEDGVALTSTSANHIANLAKEYIKEAEIQIENLNFYTTKVALINSDTENIINRGQTSEVLKELPIMIETITKAKSLIAWLREGIKAKDNLVTSIRRMDIEEYCRKKNINMPQSPNYEELSILTEEQYYDTLPIKERNRYYELETEAAIIGKFIHKSTIENNLAKARESLKNIIQNPNKVEGTGRDTLIYSFIPTIGVKEIDDIFFEFQKKHREVQAQLNSIKHNCELAINDSKDKLNIEYKEAVQEYNKELGTLLSTFKIWREKKLQEYSELKIIVPNSLLGIYNIINSLGK